MNSGYIPIHVHDHFSLLDGGATPKEYFARARELEIPAVSQTNHGTTAGWREFQRDAKEAGIKPILGIEAYHTEDPYDRRSAAKRQDGTQAYNHLTVLATNETGMVNINKLNKFGWTEGFYSKPRWGKDNVFDNSEGLIVLSGCMSGMLSKALLEGNKGRAIALAKEHKEALGDKYYIEVMATNPPALNRSLLKIADRFGIKAVMTSDCHYARKEDLALEEAMLILGTSPKRNFNFDLSKAKKMDWLERFNYLYPDRTMTFQEIEVYMRSYEDEKTLFEKQGIARDDIFAHTWEIAERVEEYPYYEQMETLPDTVDDPSKELRERCKIGLANRGLAGDKRYTDRLDEALKVISDKNFDPYFLILQDMTEWAREQGIRSGPARGSGAGSIVNYSLGITNVDPVKYNLLEFRFLDPSRHDWPDVDWDVEDTRREEVKEKFREVFPSVAGIATIQYFQGKSSIRSAARVFGIPMAEVNRALKDNDASLAMNASEEYYDWFIQTPQGKVFNRNHPEVVELARMLYGKISQMGQHASAIVASRLPIENFAPVQTFKRSDSDTERVETIALSMGEVEKMGFIKYDFLGLKALSVIGDTLNYIRDRHGKDIDIDSIDLEDSAVYADISNGHTLGVFQAEQPAYTKLILEMGGVDNFDELVASNALVRPGAKKTIGDTYIARKNGLEPVVYDHKDIKYFTENTYGCLTLFQEQTMLTCVELGGLSMEEANHVRRGLGKKKIEEILPYRDKFLEGATKKVGEAKANKIWSDIELGSEYGFNLSHSVAYSMISYQTAWLKHYYPVEFMAATIRNETNKDSITNYLIETKRMGIKVLLPHVNKSDLKAAPEGENSIRLGLTNIKYCGEKIARRVMLYRPFKDYQALKEKVDERGSGLNSRMLNSMDLVGAAEFPDNPLRGDENAHYYDVLKIPSFEYASLDPVVESKISRLGEDYDGEGVHVIKVMLRSITKRNGWARADVVDETGSEGFFMNPEATPETGKLYVMLINKNSVMRAVPLEKVTEDSKNSYIRYLYGNGPKLTQGQHHTIAFQERKTKKDNKSMANLVAVDHLGVLKNITVWPSDFESAKQACGQGMIWSYKVNEKEDEEWGLTYSLSMNDGKRRFIRNASGSD